MDFCVILNVTFVSNLLFVSLRADSKNEPHAFLDSIIISSILFIPIDMIDFYW